MVTNNESISNIRMVSPAMRSFHSKLSEATFVIFGLIRNS